MVCSVFQRAILAGLLLVAACQAPAPQPTPDPGPATPDAGAPALRGVVPATISPYDLAQPAPEGFDRAAAQRETLRHLMNLIRIDTRNPPGNEAAAAAYLQSLFEHVPGVETEVLAVGKGRANFVARLRAPKPTGRPVLILGHMDVVGADEAKWTSPPFEPTIRGEYLYGRGAIDDKGGLAAAATAIVQLASRATPLSRDVIFLATAAEEGGPALGIDWMLEHRPDLLGDAEFALNEGGRIRVMHGIVRSVNIQTTEKVPYNVKVTATGPSGHGSVPLPDNALAALSRAVGRLHEARFPMRLNETTRLYFSSLATIEPDPILRRSMLDIVGYEGRPRRLADELLSRVPIYNAVLRTGQSLTMMQGGFRTNVIPSEGTANFNVRVLPGDSVSTILAQMRHVAGEPGVTIELEGEVRESPPPSPVDTALYHAMEAAAHSMAPEAVVMPFLSTGATDGAALRAAGIPTYGILPMPLAMEDELRMHGDDERVPVRALGWATEFLYRCLDEVSR